MREPRLHATGYRFVEGEIAGLASAAHVVDFVLGGRRVTVEKTAATATLHDGDRLRALLQDPFEDTFSHVVAFQRSAGGVIHYTGPALSLHVTLIGAPLLAVGLYAGMLSLLISAASLFVLDWIISAQKVAALREFRTH